MSAERRAYLDTSALAKRYPLDDAWFSEATHLISRYPEHGLLSLDALHLTVAAQAGIAMLATADAVMAAAGLSMGFEVARF